MGRAIVAVVGAAAVVAYGAGCGSSPTAPSSPAALTLTGTWVGTIADNQGSAAVTLTVTHTGSTIAGTAVTSPASGDDGSCASCHKNKTGTLSGRVAGNVLTMAMAFAEGRPGDITPLCGVTLNGDAAGVSDAAITGTYTGSDTCEGPVTDGKLTLTRKR